jgi:transcriptional regulator with XRE-family HTH domain
MGSYPDAMETVPAPPPEGVLIRLAREAAGLRVADVARKAGVSIARWSQIENGRETRAGVVKPVRSKPGTLAHMANAVGVTPERLETEGERPDAARVLREIVREIVTPSAPHDPQPALGAEEITDPERWLWSEVLRLTKKLGRNPLGIEIFPPSEDYETEAVWVVCRETWDDPHGDLPDDAARIRLVARLMKRAGQIGKPDTQGNSEAGLCRP